MRLCKVKSVSRCPSNLGKNANVERDSSRRSTDLLSQQQAAPYACRKDGHGTPTRPKNKAFLCLSVWHTSCTYSGCESELLIELAEESCPSFRSLLVCPGGGRPSDRPCPSSLFQPDHSLCYLPFSPLLCILASLCLAPALLSLFYRNAGQSVWTRRRE